jgi:predicted enzyme related to lactoylglutathione lyase
MSGSHGRFVWYELTTTDFEAAKAFYGKVMGWGTRETCMPGSRYTLFTVGNVSTSGLIKLSHDAKAHGAAPQWVGYVNVDDVDAAVHRVKELHGTVYVPPTDMADVSRFSVVADPQMATLVLINWRDAGRQPPNQSGALGHVGWQELLTTNWERAFAFYREVFGWRKAVADVAPTGTYLQFSAGGKTIGGMFNKPTTAPVAFWLYYFNVADIGVALDRVRAERGEILEGPSDIAGGGRVARCADPQGAMFALIGRRSDRGMGYFERDASVTLVDRWVQKDATRRTRSSVNSPMRWRDRSQTARPDLRYRSRFRSIAQTDRY